MCKKLVAEPSLCLPSVIIINVISHREEAGSGSVCLSVCSSDLSSVQFSCQLTTKYFECT